MGEGFEGPAGELCGRRSPAGQGVAAAADSAVRIERERYRRGFLARTNNDLPWTNPLKRESIRRDDSQQVRAAFAKWIRPRPGTITEERTEVVMHRLQRCPQLRIPSRPADRNESFKTLSEANSAGPRCPHGVLPRCPRSPATAGDSGASFWRSGDFVEAGPVGVDHYLLSRVFLNRRQMQSAYCGRSASARMRFCVHMRSRNADRCSSPMTKRMDHERPRVLLADDHTLVMDGLRRILEPECEVVERWKTAGHCWRLRKN